MGKDKTLFKLRMLDEEYGFLGILTDPWDSTGYLYETNDGGLTWIKMNYYYKNLFFDEIKLLNKTNVYGLLYRDTIPNLLFFKASNNWSKIDTFQKPINLVRVCFINETMGWLCGGKVDFNDYSNTTQKIAFTKDGGKSWEIQRDKKFNGWALNNLQFFDENFGMATSGGGLILMTFDGGKNWREEYLYKIPDKDPAFGYINGLQIPSATTAYCIYDGDSIFKYTRDLTGVEEFPENNKGMKIKISPNPASDFIEITGVNKGLQPLVAEMDVKIYNVFGECVKEIPPTPLLQRGTIRIDVLGLPVGVYFVRCGEWTGRFVKVGN